MDLNIGIVGFGARASLWTEAHRPGRGSRVVAVCDLAERARADARTALPEASVTDSLDELLAMRTRRRHGADARRPARARRDRRARGRRAGVLREAARGDRRRRRRDARDRAPHGHPALRRAQHAAHVGRRAHAPAHPGGAHRRGEGDLVPPLRRQRRRLLLQGLARRARRRRPACCCRRARTTSTSSTGSPARTRPRCRRWGR